MKCMQSWESSGNRVVLRRQCSVRHNVVCQLSVSLLLIQTVKQLKEAVERILNMRHTQSNVIRNDNWVWNLTASARRERKQQHLKTALFAFMTQSVNLSKRNRNIQNLRSVSGTGGETNSLRVESVTETTNSCHLSQCERWLVCGYS